MTYVTVFVDDAVTGQLPGVCVKDGVPTEDQLRLSTEVNGGTRLGIAWLLLLAGPFGWIGLAVLAASRANASETLRVQLPMSDAAYERYAAARRTKRILVAVAVVAAIGTFVEFFTPALGPSIAALLVLAIFVLSVPAVFVADLLLSRASVGVELDASRRWVTLTRVHPAFEEAVARTITTRPRP